MVRGADRRDRVPHPGPERQGRLLADNGLSDEKKRSIQLDQSVRILNSPNLLGSDGEQATVMLDCQIRSASGLADSERVFLQAVLSNGLTKW